MTDPVRFDIDPELDLVLERTVDIAPSLVWQAWTTPEHVIHWFAPAPWGVAECVIDLRPGGVFRTVMRSPEGEEYPGDGCILEVVSERRLVWTDAMLPGFRPAPIDPSGQSLPFTGAILLEPADAGTQYTAIARHRNAEDCKRHDAMGFASGWGKALDQLVEHMKGVDES